MTGHPDGSRWLSVFLNVFPALEDFMWYSEGIYRSPSSSDLMHSTSSFEWERVDHAVLLVGYGEERSVAAEPCMALLEESYEQTSQDEICKAALCL